MTREVTGRTNSLSAQINQIDIHKENLLTLHCVSQRFHEYRKALTRKAGQKFLVFFKECNVYDPFMMALARRIRATVTGKAVGHLPREMSRFAGSLELTVESLTSRIKMQK